MTRHSRQFYDAMAFPSFKNLQPINFPSVCQTLLIGYNALSYPAICYVLHAHARIVSYALHSINVSHSSYFYHTVQQLFDV